MIGKARPVATGSYARDWRGARVVVVVAGDVVVGDCVVGVSVVDVVVTGGTDVTDVAGEAVVVRAGPDEAQAPLDSKTIARITEKPKDRIEGDYVARRAI